MFHRVMVAGVGALGSEVVKNLGLLGCKSVFLADADIIEEKNIAKSVLLSEGAVAGQSKISCGLARLHNWFPQTHWDGAAVEIADIEPERFQEADILFSCVDTDLARTEIAALAAKYQLPVCDAGLGGTSTRVGRVSWFPGTRSAACFACLLSSRRRAALFSIWESEVYTCWAREADAEDAWTSTPTMASIVAGLQVELAVLPLKIKTQTQLSPCILTSIKRRFHERSNIAPAWNVLCMSRRQILYFRSAHAPSAASAAGNFRPTGALAGYGDGEPALPAETAS